MLNFPSDVAVLAEGSLLIADQKNHRVRSLAGATAPATGGGSGDSGGSSGPGGSDDGGGTETTDTPSTTDDRTARLPPGSVVDARNATLTLTSALDARGRTQRATFRGARFKVVQDKRSRGIVDIHLLERPVGCSGSTARAAAASTQAPKPRALWRSDSHGRYRTHGRNSAATVRGTRWATTETCSGTRTTVTQGSVVVRDSRSGRQTVVRAGHSHLARVRA